MSSGSYMHPCGHSDIINWQTLSTRLLLLPVQHCCKVEIPFRHLADRNGQWTSSCVLHIVHTGHSVHTIGMIIIIKSAVCMKFDCASDAIKTRNKIV